MTENDYREMYENVPGDVKPANLPCYLGGVDAPFSICGGDPDGKGGGVLYWAYSLPVAMATLKWCARRGCREVKLYQENDGAESTLLFTPYSRSND